MRKCICKRCEREFYEDDSNPNIHYSNPAIYCRSCETYRSTKVGDFYQSVKGEYLKKEQS